MGLSHGVLHHTPNPEKAINEVWRGLKAERQSYYHALPQNSFNYYVRIMPYMRVGFC